MGQQPESVFDYFDTSTLRVPQLDDEHDTGDEYMVYDLEDKAGEKRRVWVNERERRLYCPVSGDDVTEDFEHSFE